MRDAFCNTLYDLVKENKKILLLTGDCGTSTTDKLKRDYPSQAFNLGIAEANMITVAAGLASSGFIPFTFAIGPHLIMRPYEQIRNDVCLNFNNVKIVGIGTGLHYSDHGPTHHAIEDFAILKVLPNMTIFSPCSPMEAKQATIAASKINGPVYIRIGRATDTGLDYEFKPGIGVEMKDGNDATIIATGATVYDAYTAAKDLEKEGMSVRVINIHTIKPLDEKIIRKAARETGAILTVEEHHLEGGLGDSVARVILEDNNSKLIKFKRMGIKDVFCSYCGDYDGIKEYYGLTKENIIKNVKKLKGGVNE